MLSKEQARETVKNVSRVLEKPSQNTTIFSAHFRQLTVLVKTKEVSREECYVLSQDKNEGSGTNRMRHEC